MTGTDDTWCDWCGKQIPPQTRRSRDGRVFCGDKCLAADLRGADAASVVDIVGELSFALLWKTALLSRFRLVASDIDLTAEEDAVRLQAAIDTAVVVL
ncbi:hypothetical protein [Nocardia vaccinii]|uniref:hypothetical protein n=1 Tax=Nocardia vaccinii TaxID=1822 RepID=UPI000A5DA906|nr:hypothetical protein [Nocardia vaccinii]